MDAMQVVSLEKKSSLCFLDEDHRNNELSVLGGLRLCIGVEVAKANMAIVFNNSDDIIVCASVWILNASNKICNAA